MSANRVKVSFIVPVYNEERNVLEVIRRLKTLDVPKEIVVVDDGSFDSTPILLRAFQDDPEVVVHLSELNSGKGTAIRLGLKLVTGDIVAIQDGDLEYNVADYLKILERFSDPSVSAVYGSRFTQQLHPGMPWRYRVTNVLLRGLANFLFRANITDEATAYKAFRRQVITAIPLQCKRFEFCPEITAKLRKRGHVIHEVPIEYNPRTIAEGKKIRAKDGLIAIATLIRLRFLND
jgi:dolichol-phosphate mannosyltransferase